MVDGGSRIRRVLPGDVVAQRSAAMTPYTVLQELIHDATGWHAVWKDFHARGNEMRIVAITDAQYEFYAGWTGIRITDMETPAEDQMSF